VVDGAAGYSRAGDQEAGLRPKRQVKVPADLAERIDALLAQRCRDGIGLARRSGLAVAGYEKVANAMRSGSVGLLLAASDGAENGRQKIAALAKGLDLAVEIGSALTAAELGAAFGREHVVHASVGSGALADRIRADNARLAEFRAGFRGSDATPERPSKRRA
jgi:ribosomal protein L7Ae-like RNA K-turn-binding protein